MLNILRIEENLPQIQIHPIGHLSGVQIAELLVRISRKLSSPTTS